jgi:hypothetical protein
MPNSNLRIQQVRRIMDINVKQSRINYDTRLTQLNHYDSSSQTGWKKKALICLYELGFTHKMFVYENKGIGQHIKREQWIENMVYEKKTVTMKSNFNCDYRIKTCC